MKKLFNAFAAVVILSAISCSKDIETIQDDVVTGEKNVSLSASVFDATKVSTDNVGAFKWQDDDLITILTSEGNNREFTAEEAGVSSDFSGHIPTSDHLDGGIALYPADENHSRASEVVSFILNANQTWNSDASCMPLFAPITVVEDKPQATFQAIGGALKLICYNIPSGATKLTFTAASKQICGEFLFDSSEGTPKIEGGNTDDADEKTITIDFSEDYSLSKVFYIPLPEVTLTGGFTIAILAANDSELFSVTSTKAVAIERNKLVVAPALNCAKATDLWVEDFSGYSADAQPSSKGSVNYAYGESSTKVYTTQLASGGVEGPELLITKSGGTFTVSNIPTNGASSMTLTYMTNRNLTLSTSTDGISLGAVSTSGNARTASIGNTNGAVSYFDVTFTNSQSNNARIDDIKIVIPGTSFTAPEISPDDDELTIAVGSLEASTGVELSNPVDGLGISCAITYPDENKWIDSAVVENDELVVTAKAANATAADYTATVTLKASGAASKDIAVTQTSCLVPNPTLTPVAGDQVATITWTKDAHAESYVAYLHTAETETPATDGDVSGDIDISGDVCTLELTGLTNDQTYYLYVKVDDTTDESYVAPMGYASVSFTPEEAKGTETNPYTVTEALAELEGKATGWQDENSTYTEGIISTITKLESDNTITYSISVDGAKSNELKVYKGKNIGNVVFSSLSDLSVGDRVVVYGKLYMYNTTPEINSGNYLTLHHPKLAAPTFSPAAGTYYSAQNVTISAADGATIYYTTDGTTPTTESDVYSAAINVATDTPIKAFAVKANCVNSDVAEAAYDIETPVQLGNPTVTCSAHGEDFLTFAWDTVTNGVDGTTEYAVSLDGGSNWETAQTDRTYTWSGLTANTPYTIKVKALGTNDGHYLESVTPGSCTQSTDAVSAGWKETALSSIGASDVFVIVGSSGYALPHDNGASSAPSTVSVTVSGTKLTGSEGNDGVIADKIKWNVSGNNDDGYVFYPNGSTTTWLYCTDTNNGVRVGTNANKLFTLTNDGYLLNSATSRYISVYLSNNDWRCYGNTNNNPQVVKFYKYTDNTPRTITVNTPSNGTVTTDPSGTTTAGTTVNITATPLTGYSVRTVSVVDGNSAAVSVTKVDDTHYRFSMPSSNATVTVTFGIKSAVNIAYGTDPANGSISISPASPVFAGETVTVTDNPDDGYMLSALKYNDGSDHNILSTKTFEMPATAVTVTATFVAVPTISVTNPITNVSATAGTYTINGAYTLLNNATSANVAVAEPDGTVVTSVSKGASDGSIRITVSGNTGGARDGSFKIKYGDEAFRTITVSQLSGSNTPAVGTVLFAETFGSSAVNPFSSYTGTGSSSYKSASTLSYTCKSDNTKIMNDTQGNCGPANLLVGGKNGGSGEWAKISGIKTYGATKVTVTWASNGSVVKVSIAESSSAAVTSANSASNSGTFTLSGEEETITLVMTAGTKSNGRVDTFQITVAE